MSILNMMSWDDVVKAYQERRKDEDWYEKTQTAKEETLRWLQEEVTIDYKDSASTELPIGIVEDLYSCPIANYVYQYYTSEDTHIDKWDRVIPNHMVEVAVGETLRCYQWDSQTQEEMFNAPNIFIPLHARNFISWFDVGEYPELMDVCDDQSHYDDIQEFFDSPEDVTSYYEYDDREKSWGEMNWNSRSNSDECKNFITESIGCDKLHIPQHDREAIAYGERNIVSKMAEKEYNTLREDS